jgi:gliding motility-associated-like protein
MQTVKTSKPPSFQITADHIHLCLKDTASLFYTGDAGISGYKWTLRANFNVSGGTLTTANMVVIPTATGNQPVYLKVTDSTGRCSAIDTLVLTVAANPTAQITTTNGVCLGDSATLGLVSRSANADSFAWYIDNTPLHQSGFINISAHTSHSGGPFVISWTTSGMHVISVIAISQEGCKSQIAYDSVLVNTPPDATFSLVTTGPLCLEDSAYFQARETGYGYSYLWTPGQFFNNVNTPSAWGRLNSQQSTIKLTVTDAFGCTSSTSQEFNPQLCCKIEFPSAFTPNGDGRNEVFRPIVSGYHNFHKFSIVNRWGQVVFESANSNFQWDGNYNGVPQDMGVYYYVLRYDCGGNTLVQKGDVTLIR